MIEYDPHRWRSTLFRVKGSMFGAILTRVGGVMLIAGAITAVHFHLHPLSHPDAGTVHGLVGSTLGLLLVFRTNSSYDRWWEGRKLWGAIVNTSRNLARAASVHLAHDPDRLTRVLKLAAAWPTAARLGLRAGAWTPDDLDPRDAALLIGAQHPPTAIAARITALLEEARKTGALTDIVFASIDANCQSLVDSMGACERIHKTPLPFAYVVHLRRAMVLFCTTLPLALLGKFGNWALGITFIVAYIMFGIEEIGVEIEDPFEGDDNDLPLEKIGATIAANVQSFIPKGGP